MFEKNFVFKSVEESRVSDAVRIAVDGYHTGQKNVSALYDKDYSSEIEDSINDLFHNGKGLMVYENDGLVGFMGLFIGENKDTGGYKTAYGPTYGYGIKKGADRGKIASLLFQHISEMLLPINVRHYAINIY